MALSFANFDPETHPVGILNQSLVDCGGVPLDKGVLHFWGSSPIHLESALRVAERWTVMI